MQTYTDRYRQITSARARARRADRLRTLLAPYTVRPVPVIPAQRQRQVRTAVSA